MRNEAGVHMAAARNPRVGAGTRFGADDGITVRVSLLNNHSSITRCPIGFVSIASFYSRRTRIGWPLFSQKGRHLGPLPQNCSCGCVHSSANTAAPSGDNDEKASLLLLGFANWLCKRALKEIVVREGLQRTGISLALTAFGSRVPVSRLSVSRVPVDNRIRTRLRLTCKDTESEIQVAPKVLETLAWRPSWA